MPEAGSDKITGARLLARNAVFNLLGQGAPLLVALFAIPLLVHGLGTDRFGVLTLAWMVIGYFSLFDLGLGRALTKLVAEKVGTGQIQEIPALVWTTLSLMAVLGFVGTMAVILLAPWLVQDALKIPGALESETVRAFYLLAFSIPLVISTAGLRGILEAQQRFDLTNLIRVPMGVFTFAGPLMMLPFSSSLVPIIAVLVVGRLLAWSVHAMLCLRVMPALKTISLERRVIGPLLRFGGWMTVVNIVSPLMAYLDRFLIGGLASITAVAYYATPYDMVTKLWVIPSALIGVLFPAFSSSFVQDRARTARLFGRGVKYMFLVFFPLTLLVVVLAHEGLDFWLGSEFARNSTHVLQLLAVGVFINSLAQIPFVLVQGVGRPDFAAKLLLLELPFYLLGLWWLLGAYGIEGAAMAWVGRIVVDTTILFAMAKRLLPGGTLDTRRMALAMVVALLILVLAASPAEMVEKGVFLLLTLSSFALVTWLLILTPEERSLALDFLQKFRALSALRANKTGWRFRK